MSRRLAAVDIGSNTTKITIVEHLPGNTFKKIFYKDFPSGLEQSTSDQNRIDPGKLDKCYAALNEIKSIIGEKKANPVKYIATHALREASNQKEIISLIEANTAIEVQIISGEEEARLTLTAILMDFTSTNNLACINAGGGSTELSLYLPTEKQKEHFYLLRFGAGNLYTNYIRSNVDVGKAIQNIGDMIRKEFHELNISESIQINEVISVGGSIYNGAYILLKDRERNFENLKGMKLSIAELESVITQLSMASQVELQKMPGLDNKRIDNILPGILIHYYLLMLLKKSELTISTKTISDGLIYEMANAK